MTGLHNLMKKELITELYENMSRVQLERILATPSFPKPIPKPALRP